MADKKKPTGSIPPSDNNIDGPAPTPDGTRRSRRRLIQVLTAGGVVTSARLLPSDWAKPVVETVALPAHAQTTGELIELGNNEPFVTTDPTPLPERPESLLASGVETAGELVQRMITAAHAGDEPEDTAVGCVFTGCARIRFVLGQNTGTLFLGVFDLTADGVAPTEISRPFIDGATGNFAGTCLESFGTFQVDLINAFAALLTLIGSGGKFTIPVELVRIFTCSPALEDDF